MKKLFSLTLLAICVTFAAFATPGPITGTMSNCLGSNGYLADSTTPGGTWSSSNTAVATIGLTTGYVYSVSVGTATITYTLGGSYVTTTYTVYPAGPAGITGTTSFCAGTSAQLSDATPGGTWSSGTPTIVTVNSSGTMYGGMAGTGYITYTTGSGACGSTSIYVTVGGTNTGYIAGPMTVCLGSTITLTDSNSVLITGTWSSSNTAVAMISSTGVVYGATLGTTIISYAVNGTCGLAYATDTVTVINTTSPGTISGSNIVNIGATTPLYETAGGGTWSSSNTTIATVDPSTGVVTGLVAGSVTITYSVSGCGGIATTTYAMSVTPIDGISGNVNFTGTSYMGQVRVWLITYNPSTLNLEAIDSVTSYCNTGTSVYYQFLSIATDSYRVKAAVYDSSTITTGYIPTYHTSSFYWYSANVINHVSGTADINEDINMAYGSVTSGPGFVGGNVTAGANRGTSTTGIAVVGMSVNLLNSSNQLIQSVRTNASGNYSFSNLPLGTYYVFPDSLNYMTTAYTGITLTSGAPSASTANFGQHTVSHTITPNITGINNVSAATSSMIAFPNPTTGKINLQWNETATEKGAVNITDITGREIYSTTMNMTEGTGVKQIDLSSLASGLYMISVKSGTINYNTKVQIGR